MLGYTEEEIKEMMASVASAKKFLLHYPSHLMIKEPMLKGLDRAIILFDGLLIEEENR